MRLVVVAPAAAPLFRDEAVRARDAEAGRGEIVRVAPPWAQTLLATATIAVLAAALATWFVPIEQTGRGRGVLRVAGGAQAIVAQTGGVVTTLGARSGDVVQAGALLVTIDSSATRAALLDADREIVRSEEDVATFLAQRDGVQAARVALLKRRVIQLGKRAEVQRANAARLSDRLVAFDRLVAANVAAPMDRAAIEGELAASRQQAMQTEEEATAARLAISSIDAEMELEVAKRRAAAKRARDRRDALDFQLRQTEARAPRAGRVDAVVTKVGDAVTPGTPLAQLLPEGSPREIVVFVAEADRAFLTEGSLARIEVDQLPVGEFGAVHAKVVRIGADVAGPADVKDVLGDTKLQGPVYRVDLALEDDDARARTGGLLRPGSMVSARFVLRKRRLAAVLFEPFAKAWRR